MSKDNGGSDNNNNTKDAPVVAVQAYYQDEENLKKLCNFLRTKHGPAIRESTLMEKRVYYLKGTFQRNSFCRASCVEGMDNSRRLNDGKPTILPIELC